MPRFDESVLGLIPARGGSKSIPYKNIAPLGGWPLIRWVIEAGKAAPSLGRVACSTDDARIAETVHAHGGAVIDRPAALATDDSPVIDTILHALETEEARTGRMPFAVALLQPTSPFTLPDHIEACITKLRAGPSLGSAQTVTKPPHNHHAYNQRLIDEAGVLRFRFEKERLEAFNKQRKPALYIFGNLVVSRSSALLDSRQVFAPPSAAVEIPAPYGLDVDSGDDFAVAQWYLDSGRVALPFYPAPATAPRDPPLSPRGDLR